MIYVDFEVDEKVFLLDVYAKTSLDNLSQADRNDLKILVDYLEDTLERERK